MKYFSIFSGIGGFEYGIQKIDPFVMPYNRFDNYQRGLARYVNMKATFNSCTWTEYCETKGIEV